MGLMRTIGSRMASSKIKRAAAKHDTLKDQVQVWLIYCGSLKPLDNLKFWTVSRRQQTSFFGSFCLRCVEINWNMPTAAKELPHFSNWF